MPVESQWVKDARAWVAATKKNQATAPFAGFPETQAIAGGLSDIYSGMGFRAEDLADDYKTRTDAQRAELMSAFANTDATTKAGYENSKNYLSEFANRLGLQQALQGPGVESQNQQMNQVLAMNNANRTNQLASQDLLRNTYGELLRDRVTNSDNLAAMSFGELYNTFAANQAAMGGGGGSGGGGGGGGRGGGGRGGRGGSSKKGSSGTGFDFGTEPSSFIAINPYNPPSGSTYSSDYVRPDVQRRPPVKVTKTPTKRGPAPPARRAIEKRLKGATSRSASLVRSAR